MLFLIHHSDSEQNVISNSKQKLNAQVMSFTAYLCFCTFKRNLLSHKKVMKMCINTLMYVYISRCII